MGVATNELGKQDPLGMSIVLEESQW